MHWINSLVATIENFRPLGYSIVLLVSLFESLAFVGVIIPGTVFVVMVGILAAQKFLDIGDVVWFVAIGAIAGDVISYYLGSHLKIGQKKRKISKHIDKGKGFIDQYGGWGIVFGRFIGPIRPIVPFVAGTMQMNKRKFFLWNVLAGFSWAITFLLIGYFFGQSYDLLIPYIGEFLAIMAIIGLLVAFLRYLGRD